MTLLSKTNPYPGINLHLNSYLQSTTGDWVSYHSSHIAYLRDYIDQQLPDNYYAVSEHGLQIGKFDAGTGWESRSTVRPDITITREHQPTNSQPQTTQTDNPTGIITLTDTLIEPNEFIGLVIYQIVGKDTDQKPVARIELLSPANKIGGSYHQDYSHKRRETLEAGLQLVEIDYLHASKPVIPNLPSYIDKQAGAYPFMVLVNDPRPTLAEGKTTYFAWHVHQPIPSFTINLIGDDHLSINLGDVYNYTYESIRYYQRTLDYAQDQIDFDTYTDEDKQIIHNLLADIRTKLDKNS